MSQEEPFGTTKPVGYWKRSLKKVGKAYDNAHRECLVVVWEVLMLRPYLQGARFVIRTDNDNLRWFLNMPDPKGMLTRWRLRISELEFYVVHRGGNKQKAADALSRTETTDNDNGNMEYDLLEYVVETTEVDEEEGKRRIMTKDGRGAYVENDT